MEIRSYGFGVYGKEKVKINGPLDAQSIGHYSKVLRNPPRQIREEVLKLDIWKTTKY